MDELQGTSSSFQESVRFAFAKAKNDILTNLNEINHLKAELIDLKKEIASLNEKNAFLLKMMAKQDDLFSLLKERRENTTAKHPPISIGTSSTGNERVLNPSEELLLHQYRVHKPAIIKRKVVELVPETSSVSVFTLYTQLVIREHLCGKTTFYRYVKELYDEGLVTLFLQNGQRMVSRKSELTGIVP